MRTIINLLLSLPISLFSLVSHAVDIHMVGDSTMADKTAEVYPETGWGQALRELVPPSVKVFNHAINGRSTKSFIDQGHWQKVVGQLKAGDYVVIQFGHNDQKREDPQRYTDPHSSYRDNLIYFIDQTRAKGAIPILATSICRRHFDNDGKLKDTHGDYPDAVRAVAKEKNVYLVDLQQRTASFLQKQGDKNSTAYFLHVKGGQYPHYPNDLQDDTHLSPLGAKTVASFFIEQIQQDNFVLANYFTGGGQASTLPLWQGAPPVAAKTGGDEYYEDERLYNVRRPQLMPRPLTTLAENQIAPAVIIFPGGGYQKLSMIKEGEEIAAWLNSIGMHAFIATYRLQEFGAPAPLLDAQQALRLVRRNAQRWQVDPNNIGVIGFSAGGHVAASVSQHYAWRDKKYELDNAAGFNVAEVSARPDFALLIYPVISMREEVTHSGSRQSLLGTKPSKASLHFYSLDEIGNPNAPPTFIIHAGDDDAVPADNAVRYWRSLLSNDIAVELLLYQRGGHGFGLRPGSGHSAYWPARAHDWLRDRNIVQ